MWIYIFLELKVATEIPIVQVLLPFQTTLIQQRYCSWLVSLNYRTYGIEVVLPLAFDVVQTLVFLPNICVHRMREAVSFSPMLDEVWSIATMVTMSWNVHPKERVDTVINLMGAPIDPFEHLPEFVGILKPLICYVGLQEPEWDCAEIVVEKLHSGACHPETRCLLVWVEIAGILSVIYLADDLSSVCTS